MPSTNIPSGERVYAIGDIHGRLDLFENIIAAIERDDAGRKPVHTTVILLGDLVDRGPDSAGVVARARSWAKEREVRFIFGNHEELMLGALSDPSVMRGFLKFGGRETLLSYGIKPSFLDTAEVGEIQDMMRETIPAEDVAFLESFEKLIVIGDYLFVHAGIRPHVPVQHQLSNDCRWIREPFLSHNGDFGSMVVHGHTITEEPEVRNNRIGIDTGAYISGTLTALGLEGGERWFLQSCSKPHTEGTSIAA